VPPPATLIKTALRFAADPRAGDRARGPPRRLRAPPRRCARRRPAPDIPEPHDARAVIDARELEARASRRGTRGPGQLLGPRRRRPPVRAERVPGGLALAMRALGLPPGSRDRVSSPPPALDAPAGVSNRIGSSSICVAMNSWVLSRRLHAPRSILPMRVRWRRKTSPKASWLSPIAFR
jgi:hypothetical protein